MIRKTYYLISGISASAGIAGLTLLAAAVTDARLLVGALLIAGSSFGFVGAALARIISHSGEMAQSETTVTQQIEKLQKLSASLPVTNNANLVQGGTLERQRKALWLERAAPPNGRQAIRLAYFGHLPSHLRTESLTEARGHQIFEAFEQPYLMADYVRLVNQRTEALFEFLESGGVCQEIYDEPRIKDFIERKHTIHDRNQNPLDEIIMRLRTLTKLLSYSNYFMSLVDAKSAEPSVPYFLLKPDVGLLLDLRQNIPLINYSKGYDCLYIDFPDALGDYKEKFSAIWKAADRSILNDRVNSWVSEVERMRDAVGIIPPEAAEAQAPILT